MLSESSGGGWSLVECLHRMADALALTLEQSAGQGSGYVSQRQSPLGSRRHRNAVERRIQGGEGGAYKIGRNHFLTQDALVAEMSGRAAPGPGVSNDGHPTRLRKAKPRSPALEQLERDIRNGLSKLDAE
jgi:hypothetical protein